MFETYILPVLMFAVMGLVAGILYLVKEPKKILILFKVEMI